jgi:predicted ester cyclase
MTDKDSKLARRFFEAQDEMRGGPDPELCTQNYLAHIASNPPMTLADHQAFARAFYGGFPDLFHTFEEEIASGDKAIIRFTLHGTHQGNFMGIPPTQKKIEVGAIAVFHIADGKVAEIRGQFDQLGMMQQLGLLPTP